MTDRAAVGREREHELFPRTLIALAAIVAPALLLDDSGAPDLLDVSVLAGIAAVLAAWKWRTIPATLAAGLGVYWLVTLLT